MGLRERRLLEEYKKTKYDQFLGQFKTTVGFEIPVDMNWDSTLKAIEGYDDGALENYLSYVFFKPLIEAFKNICIDDMGREAVKSKIQKISLGYEASTDNGISLNKGTLKMNMNFSNADDYFLPGRIGELQTFLENNL